MSTWTEIKHNYWLHNEGKYAISIYQGGNWYFKIIDRSNGRSIKEVYIALKHEDEARDYIQNLLFINQDADAFVKTLVR